MISLDTSVLTLLLNENASAPVDPVTGQAVSRCKDRIEYLVATLHKQKQSIVIPTPVLSEVLVRTGSDGLKYVEMFEKWTVFSIRDFDKIAAIELALMHQQFAKGDKKGSQKEEPWQKIKFDRQIVAICKVAQVKTIYAGDPGLASFARAHGITTFGVHELTLPPEDPQFSMSAALEATLPRTNDSPKPEEVDSGEDDQEGFEKPD
jgi:hypothetical protein